MQAIGYFLSLPFIYLVSLLPFPLLYLLSDFIYLVLYHVIGYRKKIVLENLRRSFPGKTDPEILTLRKKFYRYLCDLFLETFKTLTISKKSMLDHCRMDPDSMTLLESYFEKKQSVILVLGHLGNWEWGGNTFSLSCPQKLYVIYHPLQHPYFNRLINSMRTRFGTGLIAMNDTYREMVKMKDQVTATAFIADQTPRPEGAQWVRFMNQDTPVFRGTELIARKLNYPVIFISLHRKIRGVYDLRAEPLCESPGTLPEGELTRLHTRKLEQEIEKSPEIWLWSHRRWKHAPPSPNPV